jgi:hypothetical protein
LQQLAKRRSIIYYIKLFIIRTCEYNLGIINFNYQQQQYNYQQQQYNQEEKKKKYDERQHDRDSDSCSAFLR